MRHAIAPKESWMAEVGAVGRWPAFGRMRKVYTDNGAEFRSLSFRLGCQQQNIEYGYRPVRTPRYGGRIERLLGTFMKRMRLIPGNTFNEILNTKSPYPQQHAVLTLMDLKRWFAMRSWPITTNAIRHWDVLRSLRGTRVANPQGVMLPSYPKDPVDALYQHVVTSLAASIRKACFGRGCVIDALRSSHSTNCVRAVVRGLHFAGKDFRLDVALRWCASCSARA